MKIVLVHDYLNQLGGGERVLDEFIKMFPQAQVHALLYDEKETQGRYAGRVAKTSFLDFAFARNHHRLFIPLMPFAARSIRIPDDVDLIISDSAGFGKGIRYNKKTTKHLCYVHTPLRYAWETATYFNLPLEKGGDRSSGEGFKNLFIRFFGAPAFWFVRRFDYWAGQQPDLLIANSNYIADKIKRYYGRDSVVVYPPVSDFWFASEPILPLEKGVPPVGGEGFVAGLKSLTASLPAWAGGPLPFIKGEYYLAVGRLLHYKRFDLIIDACAKAGVALKIAGTGPERAVLALQVARYKLHAPIQFLGYVSEQQLRELYAGAKAFIMANEEDFGLVMVEAQACGTPVIAYGKGGAREIIKEVASSKYQVASGNGLPREYARNDRGVTGTFFSEQTVESLVEAIKKFENGTPFDRQQVRESAKKFSQENFRKGIEGAVARIIN